MIRIKLTGKFIPEVKLCFQHPSYEPIKGIKRRKSIAQLWEGDGEKARLVASAEVKQNHKDTFNRAEGRERALKALLNTDPKVGPVSILCKGDRTAVWNAYWDRPRQKPTPPPPATPLAVPVDSIDQAILEARALAIASAPASVVALERPWFSGRVH